MAFSNGLTEARDDAILLDTIADRSNFKPDASRILPLLYFRKNSRLKDYAARFLHNPLLRHNKRTEVSV